MKKIIALLYIVIRSLLNDKILNDVWYGYYKTYWQYKKNKFNKIDVLRGDLNKNE